MAMFKAFKPSGMEKIARSMGYQGNMQGFQDFLAQDPMRQQKMNDYTNKAMQMAKGGVVKMQTGGTVQPLAESEMSGVTQETVNRMYDPQIPTGGVITPTATLYDPSQEITSGTGTVTGQVQTPTTMAGTYTAGQQTSTQANIVQADTAAGAVDAAVSATQAAQADPTDPRSQVTAAQQTASSVGNLQAAQGNAVLINNPVQRQIQNGELISNTGVDAVKAAQVTAQTDAAAATANPTAQAMVQNQQMLAGGIGQAVGGLTTGFAAGGGFSKDGFKLETFLGQ